MGLPEVPPAGRRDARGLLREALLYALAVGLAVVLVARVYHLGEFGLSAPFRFKGDAVYYALQIKTLIETGWVYHNPALSAPFELDLYDFAHFDTLHLAVMKLFTAFTSDWAVILNLYYFLTYPLTALTTLLLLRRLGVQPALAVAFSLLYAFQPYHHLRGEGHVMLAAYYHIPLLLLACLWLSEERGLGRVRADGGAGWLVASGRFWAAAAFFLLAASAGHYYAAWGCLFAGITAVRSAALFRRWRPLVHVGLLGAVTAAGFAANMLPNVLYWRENGHNRVVSEKPVQFTETFALKVAQLFVPAEHHRVKQFAAFSERYEQTSPTINENKWSSVGLTAGAGLVFLLGAALWPRRPGPADGRLRLLSALTVAAILLATAGGFGSLISYLVTPQIHAYTRMCIYLALFGLLAAAGLAHRLVALVPWPGPRQLTAVTVAGLVLAAGLYDQTPKGLLERHQEELAAFQRHAAFGRAVEQALPAGTMVFQLPTAVFPFSDGKMDYDHFHAYLHTHGLRWSEPAMANRPPDTWREWVTRQPPDQVLRTLALAGFGGVLLDVRLGRPEDKALFEKLSAASGAPPVHDGGTRYVFDLRGYAAGLRQRSSPEEWRRASETVLGFTYLFGREFELPFNHSAPNYQWTRWCQQSGGQLTLLNRSDEPIQVVFDLPVFPSDGSPKRLTLEGVVSGTWDLGLGTRITRTITLPPGRHTVDFRCDGTPLRVQGKTYWFRVESPSIRPVLPGP
jgi:phosphoglycerol transferase